jgi:hypothetical protein
MPPYLQNPNNVALMFFHQNRLRLKFKNFNFTKISIELYRVELKLNTFVTNDFVSHISGLHIMNSSNHFI